MISSDIIAEIPIHLGLALCGALGYAASKYANGLCPHRARPSKVVEEELEKPQTPANASLEEESQSGIRTKRRSKAKKNSTRGASSAEALKVVEATEATLVEEALEVVEATEVTLVSETPQIPAHAADLIDTPVTTQPVNERIVRLMAKKAERKARKQELMQMEEQKQVEESHEDVACAEEKGEDQVLGSQGGDIEIEEQADRKLISDVKHTIESEKADEDLDLVRDDCVAKCHADVDVVLAELSTSDEALMPICEEQDSSCDDTAIECVQQGQQAEADASDEEEFLDHSHLSAPCNAETAQEGELWIPLWQAAVQTPVDDAWMAPFDELVRSREEAERDYCEVQAQEFQYLPVVCVENQQQFYTDGEQLYMLACIEAPEDSKVDAPRLLQPVVDVNDPLHMQFAQDLYAGIVQLPPDQSKVQVLPARECTTFDPALSAHQELWDVCWDVAL